MLRVCIIGSRGFPVVYSGYETLVSHLAPALVLHGMDVTVYCHRHLFGERPGEVEGVRLVYVRGMRGKRLSQYSHSGLAAVHAAFHRFDAAIILNVANGLLVPFLERTHVRTVVHVDGVEWERPKWRGLGARVFRAGAAAATRSATSIVTDADAMRQLYLDEFSRDSVVIAYGADPDPVAPTKDEDLLESLGLAPRGYFVILGRLVPDNNAELLVEAFMTSGVGKKLVVIGDVPYRDRYAARLKSLGDTNVVFTGYVNDQRRLRAIIGNASLYLHGHEYGGTNPSLLLAMSTGVPIAALDTVFSREVLPECPGVFFFPKSVRAAAEVLREVEICLVDRPVVAFTERLLEKYQWSSVTKAYANLLYSITGQQSRVE